MAGHAANMGENGNGYMVFVGRPGGKRLLGKPRHRWKDNPKMNIRETELGGMKWIHLAKDRDQWRTLANTALNLRFP
jgi:hypothetical protein